jgi:integrase
LKPRERQHSGVEEAAAPLTDRAVAAFRAIPGKRRVHADGLVPGLVIRVTPNGRKTWSLRYSLHGRQRRLTIGRYPTWTVAEARKKAKYALVKQIANGIDPATAKHDARSQRTFADLATAYLAHAKLKKKSWSQDEGILNRILLPIWRHRPITEIARADVKEVLAQIVTGRHRTGNPKRQARPAPVMANRTQALISTMFNYAVREEWTQFNPALRLPIQNETSRDRVLSDDEIRVLWAALEIARQMRGIDEPPAPISAMIAIGLEVLFLTAQRPGEVFTMRWIDVDLDNGWWLIPASVAKNRQAHRVPLTSRVVALIRAAQALGPAENQWVFGGGKGGSVAARAVKAMRALRNAGAIDFAVHRHDLRRTAATHMGAAGIPRTTIAHVLNHVDRGSRATQVYDRYEHDAEKRMALEAWARRLDAILGSITTATVLPFMRVEQSGDVEGGAA